MKKFLQNISFLIVGASMFLARPAMAATAFPSLPPDLVPCAGASCNWCNVFKLLQTVFNTAEVIIFPIIVIFIIYGAVLYIISSITGSEEGISKARETATDAIIGLIIIMLTFIIINATIIGIVGQQVSITNFVNLSCSDITTDIIPATGTQQ